jgi:hypothetical protein
MSESVIRRVVSLIAPATLAALALAALELLVAAPAVGRASGPAVAPLPARAAVGSAGPYTSHLPFAYARWPVRSLYGIEMANIHPLGGLDQMAASGSSWVRYVHFNWAAVEHTKGVYDWASMRWVEDELTSAARRGLQVVGVVRFTPAWAQKYPPYSCGPIKDDELDAFGDYLHALVQRFSGPPWGVKHWEIWNEPDIDRYLFDPVQMADSPYGCWGDHTDPYYGGGTYAEMLKAAYPRIKQADPQAQVLVGGLLLDCDPTDHDPLTSAGCENTVNPNAALFLEGILRGGGGPYFDGVAYHAYDYATTHAEAGCPPKGEFAYCSPKWGSSSAATGPVLLAKARYIRDLLARYGVAGKYLMNTESAVVDSTGERLKANYVAQAYAAAGALGLRANIWYRLLGWEGRNTALLSPDLKPLPAYTAFVASRAQLAGAAFLRELAPADLGGSAGLTAPITASVKGYAFDRGAGSGGGEVWVVWSLDQVTRTLTLPGVPARAYDVLGAPLPAAQTLTLYPPGRLLAYVRWQP